MTAPSGGSVLKSTLSSRRRWADRFATTAMWGAVALALIPIGAVLIYVAKEGLGNLSWAMLSKPIPTPRTMGPGIGPAIAGTLIITLCATLLAVPLGILAAIFLNEYGGKSHTASAIRFLTNVMSGVPSIVMGLFIYTIWVLRFKSQTAWAGALALACLMLPIIIRSAEEMLRLVPQNMREASLALGASRSRTILTVVIPAALPGITSGVLLAVARAAGETAPLLFTIGATLETNLNPFRGANVALSQLIFANAGSPYVGAKERAWAAAFTLIAIVLILTIVSRLVVARLSKR